MELKFLPERVRQALLNLDINYLYEIRLRVDFPIKVKYKDRTFYLSDFGTSNDYNLGIVCEKDYITHIINSATEHSIYAFNDKIKEGYITTKDGVRIGLAGECVFENDKISQITEFAKYRRDASGVKY